MSLTVLTWRTKFLALTNLPSDSHSSTQTLASSDLQPLGASPSDGEELPRLARHQVRELRGGGEVRVGGEPELDGVIRGQGDQLSGNP